MRLCAVALHAFITAPGRTPAKEAALGPHNWKLRREGSKGEISDTKYNTVCDTDSCCATLSR